MISHTVANKTEQHDLKSLPPAHKHGGSVYGAEMWVNDPKNSTLGSNTGKCLKPSTLKTHKHTHVSHCLYLEYTKDAYTWQAPEPDHSVCVDTLRPSFTQMLLRHKSLEMTIHMGGETARLLFSVIELIPTE